MHLSYEKLGSDHVMFGKVDYIVMDGLQAVCYKSKEGYLPLSADGTNVVAPANSASDNKQQQRARSLFVLSFKINDEAEEITFKSKKKMDKTIAFYQTHSFITDINFTEYQLAN
ncbi:MAG TPA: hypothetical protein DD716_02805 [Thiomicrospira sp.]|jgi:hypothetical protein|nr:hypothetical protein [Thiomicrospira sp.]